LSGPQQLSAKRIAKALDDQVRFEFRDLPLAQVASFLSQLTWETFVLSPKHRKADPAFAEMTVTGSAEDIPLREALTKLLEPQGVTFVVRDEVVVLTKIPAEKRQ
jgi:type II secretory pathway component GspD/PulD (secretin)